MSRVVTILNTLGAAASASLLMYTEKYFLLPFSVAGFMFCYLTARDQ